MFTPAALQGGFFHAYQNLTMPGGTAQYAGASGSANIEFEAKLLKDISLEFNMINGSVNGGAFSVIDPAYDQWLKDITNNFTVYPTSFTPTQLSQHFGFIPEFLHDNPGYANDVISYTLGPTAIFNLINSSPCSH